MLCDVGLGAEVSFLTFFLDIFFHVLLQQTGALLFEGASRERRQELSDVEEGGWLVRVCRPLRRLAVFCCFLGNNRSGTKFLCITFSFSVSCLASLLVYRCSVIASIECRILADTLCCLLTLRLGAQETSIRSTCASMPACPRGASVFYGIEGCS
ncbi:unnamed protein product, partial [Ectocarpus sp. 8 AP-2014]